MVEMQTKLCLESLKKRGHSKKLGIDDNGVKMDLSGIRFMVWFD
jgi:hypothetical protein